MRIPFGILAWLLVAHLAPLQAADTLTHGPMMGFPTSHSVRVWARTARPGQFTVRYKASEGSKSQWSRPVNTSFDHDCTGWLELTGLQPDTRYECEVIANGLSTGQMGSFRTLPSADEVRNTPHNPKGLFNFQFQFGSCANQNPLHGIGHSMPAYDTLNRQVRDKVQFSIMNGDWLYEEVRDYPASDWMKQVGVSESNLPSVVQVAPTIVGVWENYKTYLGRAKNLADWHANLPGFFTFDDHELVNDIRGCGTIGFRERRAVFRDIGIQAWYDYLGWANPVPFGQDIQFGKANLKAGSDVLVDAKADFTRLDMSQAANLHVQWGTPTAGVDDIKLDDQPGDPNAGVYEIVKIIDAHRVQIRPAALANGNPSYSIGRRSYWKMRVSNCDYFALDCKTHRQMHDPKNPMKRGVTMLGDQQREWLLREMKASDADFFFVVSSVNFTIPHSGAGGYEMAAGKDEAWTALLDEREKIIHAWDKLKKPVFVLTADLHNSFAVKITDLIWEFASGPHNSVNHVPANDEGGRPATGKFKSGPRTVDIRWSSYVLPDLERLQRLYPHYCVAQINNVFNMPQKLGDTRWVAFPHPQVTFQYFDGRTGELRYAESISTAR